MELGEARKALRLAREELGKYRKDREALRLRDACEKGWLAVTLATDALLVKTATRDRRATARGGCSETWRAHTPR